ncbi:MAG: hypothetical protein JWO12_184, partial [Frankiales bacterium]|nr:hypothetical protein [Frankiales bacterium]
RTRAGTAPTATTGRPAAPVPARVLPKGSLAATGSGPVLPVVGALLLGSLLLVRRLRAR